MEEEGCWEFELESGWKTWVVVGKGGGRIKGVEWRGEERRGGGARCGFIARMPEDHAAAGSARASNNLRVFSNASWNRAASNSLNSSPFPHLPPCPRFLSTPPFDRRDGHLA